MTKTTKQKITNFAYVILGISPLGYVISFISFLYYTGNGFGKELIYNPHPEKKTVNLTWLNVIRELENFWIVSFFLWILMLIITRIFLIGTRTKSLIIATVIVFIIAIYLSFFSVYGGHEGWIDDYHREVPEITRR